MSDSIIHTRGDGQLWYNQAYLNEQMQALQSRLAEAEARQAWTKCAPESMPAVGVKVFACGPKLSAIVSLTENGTWEASDTLHYFRSAFTHWRQLGPLPEGVVE